jgi:1,4-dihydroxy-2-naphthoyl-CoA hydrolase
MPLRPDRDVAYFQRLGQGHLPGLLGLAITQVAENLLRAELPLRQELFAPNGYLHAGTIVSLADTAAGYACLAMLPDGATSFTTIELKANFLGTAKQGTIACETRGLHLGRTTQIWDATVTSVESGRALAAFRCTQLILYPR